MKIFLQSRKYGMKPRPKEAPGMTNRIKSMIAKRGYHWCDICDANLVGQFGRCSVCGRKSQRKIRSDKINYE